MNPVIYRIFYPYLFCTLSFLIAFIINLKGFRKTHPKKTIIKKRKKRLAILFFILFLILSIVTTYLSFDIFLQDNVTTTATYVNYTREKELFARIMEFENNETLSIWALHSQIKEYKPIKGTEYEIIYSRRTQMLISMKEKSEDG